MKRIVIIIIMLGFCIAFSAYSRIHTQSVNDKISASVSRCIDAMEADDPDALMQEVDALSDFWDDEEDYIIHFLRHAQIDDITKSIARLRALTVGEDYSELMAELDSVRWQMDHINRSERMIFQNLL